MNFYKKAEFPVKRDFLLLMVSDFGLNLADIQAHVTSVAKRLSDHMDARNLSRSLHALTYELTPLYAKFFKQILFMHDGLHFLLELRADLLVLFCAITIHLCTIFFVENGKTRKINRAERYGQLFKANITRLFY
jgi:hypothetical protein